MNTATSYKECVRTEDTLNKRSRRMTYVKDPQTKCVDNGGKTGDGREMGKTKDRLTPRTLCLGCREDDIVAKRWERGR